jgi:hypothetical protein
MIVSLYIYIIHTYIYIIYYNIIIYYIKNNNYNNEKHRVHAVQKARKKHEDPRTGRKKLGPGNQPVLEQQWTIVSYGKSMVIYCDL